MYEATTYYLKQTKRAMQHLPQPVSVHIVTQEQRDHLIANLPAAHAETASETQHCISYPEHRMDQYIIIRKL